MCDEGAPFQGRLTQPLRCPRSITWPTAIGPRPDVPKIRSRVEETSYACNIANRLASLLRPDDAVSAAEYHSGAELLLARLQVQYMKLYSKDSKITVTGYRSITLVYRMRQFIKIKSYLRTRRRFSYFESGCKALNLHIIQFSLFTNFHRAAAAPVAWTVRLVCPPTPFQRDLSFCKS